MICPCLLLGNDTRLFVSILPYSPRVSNICSITFDHLQSVYSELVASVEEWSLGFIGFQLQTLAAYPYSRMFWSIFCSTSKCELSCLQWNIWWYIHWGMFLSLVFLMPGLLILNQMFTFFFGGNFDFHIRDCSLDARLISEIVVWIFSGCYPTTHVIILNTTSKKSERNREQY